MKTFQRYYISLFLLTFCNLNLIAQQITLNDLNKEKYGYHIISEEKDIIFHGASGSHLVEFSTKKRYKVWNQEGIEALSLLELPEAIDPTYIRHSPKARNYQDLFDNLKKIDFEVKKISSEGNHPLKFKKKVSNVKMVTRFKRYGNYNKFTYNISDIAKGDTIEINYKFNFEYRDNFLKLLTFRHFFHDSIPKEKTEFRIAAKKKLYLDISYHNGASPDTVYFDKSFHIYEWKYSNLKACINEVNSRPYSELPYIILKAQVFFMTYNFPSTLYDTLVPAYSVFAMQREKEHLQIINAIDQGLKLKDYNQFRSFYNSETDGVEHDSTNYLKLKTLKNRIANEFDFQDDRPYFNRENNYRINMGTNANNHILRDLSRYELYLSIIRKLKLPYFTAYAGDTRSGMLNEYFLRPMHEDDYMFLIQTKDNKFHFLYPKSNKFGLHLDEVPFYFENTTLRLVSLADYRKFDAPISEQIREFTLPKGKLISNSRTNSVLAKLNVGDNTFECKSKIKLSGQFSTMCRGGYSDNYTDITADSQYGNKIWESATNYEVKNSKVKIKKDVFPFNTTVNSEYILKKLIDYSSDSSELILNSGFLIDHINPFSASCDTNRVLDFYSDFTYQDTYTYLVQLDKDINVKEKNITVTNDFAEYKFNVNQISASSFKVSSYLLVKKPKVASDDIQDVCNIYNTVSHQVPININLSD